jgi:hypothetical protein
LYLELSQFENVIRFCFVEWKKESSITCVEAHKTQNKRQICKWKWDEKSDGKTKSTTRPQQPSKCRAVAIGFEVFSEAMEITTDYWYWQQDKK